MQQGEHHMEYEKNRTNCIIIYLGMYVCMYDVNCSCFLGCFVDMGFALSLFALEINRGVYVYMYACMWGHDNISLDLSSLFCLSF